MGETARYLAGGRYRLSAVLGQGGMGVVWRGTDELIGRQVAIKELRAPVGSPSTERQLFGQRALSEARNAGRVSHPHIVAIHDVVPAAADDDAVYLIMELVEAPTLADLLDEHGPLTPERAARIGLQTLQALDAAHALGVVHRDVKPSNILVQPGDQVKLADFGIAHAMDDPRLTRSGVMGTHAYLAPEVFEEATLSPAVDLWSLGATLYHAVEGTDPFHRDTTAATLRAILLEDSRPPRCDPPLATVITGLLTRDPTRGLLGRTRTLPPSDHGAADSAPLAVVTPHDPRESEATRRQTDWESLATRDNPLLQATRQQKVQPGLALPSKTRRSRTFTFVTLIALAVLAAFVLAYILTPGTPTPSTASLQAKLWQIPGNASPWSGAGAPPGDVITSGNGGPQTFKTGKLLGEVSALGDPNGGFELADIDIPNGLLAVARSWTDTNDSIYTVGIIAIDSESDAEADLARYNAIATNAIQNPRVTQRGPARTFDVPNAGGAEGYDFPPAVYACVFSVARVDDLLLVAVVCPEGGTQPADTISLMQHQYALVASSGGGGG